VNKLVRELRDRGMETVIPSQEALLFSVYYAAVTSMDQSDVSVAGNKTY
jgi:hypothetical protein